METRGAFHDHDETAAAWLPERADRAARAAQLEVTAGALHRALQADPAIGETTYHIWLKPLRLVDAERDTIYIAAPDHIRTWVAERFARLLERHAAALAGRPIEIRIGPDA